ncbi:MAG: hypothetical protein ISR96_11385 [Nitrospira sp.]|nr:hypothetical protein [Nitrospira sp.]
MTYKELLNKQAGKKLHYDLAIDGYYLLDFTGRSFHNGTILEANDDFVIVKDELDDWSTIIPYYLCVIRLPGSPCGVDSKEVDTDKS